MQSNKSKISFSLKSLAILFATCALGSSQCILKNQKGICEQCSSTDILDNNICYPKIRGCLVQDMNACTMCQNAFTKVGSACVRTIELQIKQKEENVIPPVVIEKPNQLTKQQIQKREQENLNKVNSISQNNDQGSQQPMFPPGSYRPVTNFEDILYLRAKGFLFNNRPQLNEKDLTLLKAEIQVVAGTNFRFTYQNKVKSETYEIVIFRGLNGQFLQRSFNVIKKQTPQTPILGGFSAIQNLQDLKVQLVLQFIFNNNKNLKRQDLAIKKAQRQTVAGTNYKFTFVKVSDPSQQFQLVIFEGLDGTLVQNSINQIIKRPDESPILGGYSPFTDFSNPKFIQAQNFFFITHPELSRSELNLVSAETQIVAGRNFRLIYENKDKTKRFQTQIFQRINIVLKEKYFIETIINKPDGLISSSVLRQISSFDKQNFTTFLVKSFQKSKTIGNAYLYFINIFTKSGQYKLTVVQNQSNAVSIEKIEQISLNSCFQLQDPVIIKNNQKISQIKQFIKKTNPDTDLMQLTAVEAAFVKQNLKKDYISYKLLYSSPLMFKRVFKIDEKSPNLFQIKNSAVLNNGSQIISVTDQPFLNLSNLLLQNYPQLFKGPSNIPQVKIAEMQGNRVRAIYQIGKEVYQATSIRNSRNQITNVNFSKIDESKASIPINYKSQQIINVQDALKLQKIQMTDKLFRSQYSHYLGSGPVVLVAVRPIETEEFIRILYQTSIGLFEGSVKYTPQTKTVKLSNFVLTGIKSVFTQACSQRNTQGKCISCKENQILSLNSCFKKINDCKTQIGSKCYSCQAYSFGEGESTCDTICGI